jgi:AcrR family transcriptional regulator
MAEQSSTEERILRAFLQLVTQRGLVATTTSALAEAADVNEVTIFRHFKDKQTLVHALFDHFDLAGRITDYQLSIDASSPEHAASGLFDCLKYLRNTLNDLAPLLQFSISEYWKFPEVKEESALAPLAARKLIESALIQAQPQLRSAIDLETTTLSLMGLLLLTVLWNQNQWLSLSNNSWDYMLKSAIHPLIKENERNS